MKTKTCRSFTGIILLSLFWMLACGGPSKTSESNDPDSISKLQTVGSPDLSKLEPKAKQSIETLREKLDELTANKDTPKSTLGLAYGQMGTQYFINRFSEEALACYRNAAFLQPTAFRWRYYLGRLHMEEGRADEAKAALEKTLSLQPNHVASNVLLGQMALQAGDDEQAETFFKKVLEKQMQNAPAHYAMGAISLQKGDYETAARHLQTCLLIQPYARATHGLLAKALRGMEQNQAADIQDRAKTNRKPILRDDLMDEVMNQRFLVLYRIAEALRINDRDKDAVTLYTNAIDIRPDISGPRLGRLVSLVRMGEHQQALDFLADDILAGNDAANFKHLMARILAASQDDSVRNGEKALVILEDLREKHMSPTLVETMAMALASLGKFPTAIQYQETAIEMAIKAEQPELLSSLERNLAAYRENKPSGAPWAKDDPFFKIRTYQGESQVAKPPGA